MYNSGKFNALKFNAVTADNAIKLFSNCYETINAQLSAAQIFYLANNSYEIVNEEVELVSGVILVANPSENISSQCQIVGVVFLTENAHTDITASVIVGANYYWKNNPTENITANLILGGNYYLSVKHRNSLETWSGSTVMFTGNSLTYDFTTSAGKSFGNNAIPIGGKYCIYSGDVLKDGQIELSDVIQISNAANNFVSGYTPEDLNGDEVVDLSDVQIVYNNSASFVIISKP